MLNIRRSNGQEYYVRNSAITTGSQKVFGVETVENEMHVLTGPRGNRRPTRRVRFNDCGAYKGSTALALEKNFQESLKRARQWTENK